MIGKYNLEQAEKLIKLARESIKEEFSEGKVKFPEGAVFKQTRGVFVTLHNYPSKELRGCIGIPYPTFPVAKAVYKAAKDSAFSDPRFKQLGEEEIDKIILELSILTMPQECKTDEIEIGKDGLMCNYVGYSGLLLPQVATEYKMSRIEFLECLCEKAGLPKDTWQKNGFKLMKFQAQVFSEETPNGKVVEK